jgi:hypothetical protein
MNSVFTLIAIAICMVSSASAELVDGVTVLNNLSKYSKLYVTYNNCAWSPYAANNNNNNACGANGGDYWYMGLSECFRANVAYSLYGVLKDEEDKGCNKNTFINSFFTTTGISTFTDYMTVAGATFTETDDNAVAISSDCQANNDDANEAQQDSSSTNNVKVNALSTSYGVGCADKTNMFVIKTYGGAYCDERDVQEVTDTLDTFNNDMSQVNCVAIYDEVAAADQENQQNNGASAIGLLTYSEPCNVYLYSSECPDPYGKLHHEARVSAHTMAFNDHPRREVVKTVFSWLLMGFGVVLICASGLVYFRKMKSFDGQKDANASKKRNIFARTRNMDNKTEKKKEESEKKPGFLAKIKGKLARTSSNV